MSKDGEVSFSVKNKAIGELGAKNQHFVLNLIRWYEKCELDASIATNRVSERNRLCIRSTGFMFCVTRSTLQSGDWGTNKASVG